MVVMVVVILYPFLVALMQHLLGDFTPNNQN